MSVKIFTQFIFIAKLLTYSLIISAVIKYIVPNWSLLNGLTNDTMSAIAFGAITIPVGLFAFVLWLRR